MMQVGPRGDDRSRGEQPLAWRIVHIPRTAVLMPCFAVAATACTGGAHPRSGASGSTTPQPTLTTAAPSPTTPAAQPGSATPTATAATTSAAALPTCTTAHLTLKIGETSGAAGSTYTQLVLTNRGAKCRLVGYPGVSFLDSNGQQVGLPALRQHAPVHAVVLAPGAPASATLRTPNTETFDAGACRPHDVSAIRLYPPGSTSALSVPDATTVCTTQAGRAEIGPVIAGAAPH
jgi:hypothetical protein